MTRSSRSSLLPRPLRRLRDWLRGIERHSATRKGGVWARATEWALILSFPIGILLAFGLDELGTSEDREIAAVIRLGRPSTRAPIEARSIPIEERGSSVWRDAIPLAEVQVVRRTIRFGWPFPGRIETPPPAAIALPVQDPDARIDLLDEGAIADLHSRTGSDLAGGFDAVMSVLETGRRHEALVSAMRANLAEHQRFWPSTIALFGILWLLVFVASAVSIRLVQAGSWTAARLQRRRIVKRLSHGLCPDCRYDLRAERFPKRCPECGRRIWG